MLLFGIGVCMSNELVSQVKSKNVSAFYLKKNSSESVKTYIASTKKNQCFKNNTRFKMALSLNLSLIYFTVFLYNCICLCAIMVLFVVGLLT